MYCIIQSVQCTCIVRHTVQSVQSIHGTFYAKNIALRGHSAYSACGMKKTLFTSLKYFYNSFFQVGGNSAELDFGKDKICRKMVSI